MSVATVFMRLFKHAASTEESGFSLDNRILKHLHTFPHGATSYELAEASGIDRVTVSPRLRPMQRQGLIKEMGKRPSGPANIPSIVWAL